MNVSTIILEFGDLSLSGTQKELLDKCRVPEDLQDYVGQQLNDDGLPVEFQAPDFLTILTDHLKASESLLETKRSELQHIESGQLNFPDQASAKVAIERLEQKIKVEWLFCTSLWRAVEKVVANASEYGVSLQPLHVQYAIDKKILSVVEIIRFAKPEFFQLKSFSIERYEIVCCAAMFIGALLGPWVGFLGAIRQCGRGNRGIMYGLMVLPYGLLGMITGCAMAATTGAKVGRQTGYLGTSLQLAVQSTYINPFHQAPGTKNQQNAELHIQEQLFHLAQTVT